MNRITELFQIKYPIIQGGMVWCSAWELVSAVSNAGGLGLLGAGSMNPDILREQIRKCKQATDKPFGVNIPIIFSHVDAFMQIVVEEKVPIVFTSAGNPMKWTHFLKEKGIKVAHVVANTKGAKKCEEAGCDAIVAEGFEAGGHNGKEETTTMVLIPMIKDAVTLPLIAAGGIASGRAMLATMALGSEGVQIGSRFIASLESSAHQLFKEKILETKEGDTFYAMKKLVGVRLLNNQFAQKIYELENNGADVEKISELLGRGRAKKGMYEGDLVEGELELGQVAAAINKIQAVADIFEEIITEYNSELKKLTNI